MSIHLIDEYGTKFWFDESGFLHRENGPAIERASGSKEWLHHGRYHREDGPAISHSNEDEYWWKNGLRHRKDGPAVSYISRNEINNQWWLNGEKINISSQEEFERYMKLSAFW